MPREVQVVIAARDKRFLKAAREVIKNYQLKRGTADAAGRVAFQVTGGTAPYEVRAHAGAPTCTCPDAAKLGGALNAGFCKHIIGVLLDNDDLRCQLLDLFL